MLIKLILQMHMCWKLYDLSLVFSGLQNEFSSHGEQCSFFFCQGEFI